MSAAFSAPRDAEPSQHQNRAQHHLPPKSYAEAIVNGTDDGTGGTISQANGAATVNDVNGFEKVNGPQKNIYDGRVLYDKHISCDGEKLTSIKLNEAHEGRRKHDSKPTAKPMERTGKKDDTDNAKLASGRRAGAGWERSALVLWPRSILNMLTSTASVGHLSTFHYSDDFRH